MEDGLVPDENFAPDRSESDADSDRERETDAEAPAPEEGGDEEEVAADDTGKSPPFGTLRD